MDSLKRLAETIAFLRMAAAQMRSLADRAPEISAELQHIAHQLDAEAADLTKLSPE